MAVWRTNPRVKIGAGVVVAVLGVAAVVIATHWPFTQGSVVGALEQTFASSVELKSFHVTYFAPGCVMEGVTFRRNFDSKSDANVPPIATVERLTVIGSYTGFFMFPKRIPRVKVEGLHVFASAESERAGNQALPSAGTDQTKLVIGEINADGAVVEFSSGAKGAAAVKLEIATLTLDGVGDDRSMAFHVALKNPTPPAEIRADGRFGPLRRDNVGRTAASGAYIFEHADLGVFPGIGGTLASTGKFRGVLEQLEVAGSTDVPDFEVDVGGHPVHMKTEFAATVNGMNGDVALKSVSVEFGKTSLAVRGDVAGKAARQGKSVSLAGTQQQGTIQDWLRLLAKAENPAMTGAMNFRAQVQVPPGTQSFIQRVNLQGDFVIGSGDFTKPTTQRAVNNLSEVALGEKGKNSQKDEPATVAENMKGHVEMKNATATFTDLYFGVPGALAHMHGTYGILTQKIDLHGNLRVDNKLSKGSTGIKAELLKVAEPFFKKKKQAEIVPIKVGGTFAHPSYGLDVVP